MKLLIVTQTLDSKHSVLGFFVRWVLEFAKQCEQVTVFCLDKGSDIFPDNVEVIHIPRAWGGIKSWPFTLVHQAFIQRKKYTHVFVHMNPEYVLIAGFLWRLFRKRIGFWYAHGTVTLRLKIATFFSHSIVSSTQEGFRYNTKKLHLVGQGIDLSFYENVNTHRPLSNPVRLVSIGRISSSKRMEMLLETVANLVRVHKKDLLCTIIGGPVTDMDRVYENKLKIYAETEGISDNVVWKGPLPLKDAIDVLKTQDIFLHFGNTGSLDKAVLDAMACGVIVCSSNEAVKTTFSSFKDVLFLESSIDAGKRVNDLFSKPDEVIELRKKFRARVEENFSLTRLIKYIIQSIQ